MALIWIDGFDALGQDGVNVVSTLEQCGYTYFTTWIANVANTYADTATGIGFSIQPSGGHSGYSARLSRNFPATGGKIIAGFRYKNSSSAFDGICQFSYTDGLGSYWDLIKVFVNGENGITVTCGTSGSSPQPSDPANANNLIGATPPNVLFAGVWQYIEIALIPEVSVIIKIDGTQVLNATISTENATGGGSVNFFSLGNDANYTSTVLYDDLYIEDGSTSSFDDFLGDVVVHSIFPNADAGTNTMAQFGGGVGHFTSVDEQTPDGDASYCYSNTSGDEELYSLGALPTDVLTVLAVSVNVMARKATPGPAYYEACIKHGSTEVDSSQYTANVGYIQQRFIVTTPPDGGSWTNDIAQNCQIGFKIP